MRILAFIGRRLLQLIPVLLGVITATFLLVRVLPGDPIRSILGPNATEADAAAARARFGLDKPLWNQFLDYLRGLATGDFGTSIQSGTSVGREMALRIGPTLELVAIAVSIAVILAIALGTYSARRAGVPPITPSGFSHWRVTRFLSSGWAWSSSSSVTPACAGSPPRAGASTPTPTCGHSPEPTWSTPR